VEEAVMRLGDRLHAGATAPPPLADEDHGAIYQDVKSRLHEQLIDRIDLGKLDTLSAEQLRAQLRDVITGMIANADLPLNRVERERLIQEVLDEVTGLGPLEPLLADRTLSDILVNGHDTVYVERDGLLHQVPVRFRDDDHLLQIINRIVSRVGRRIDETSPMVDARLPDGSRVNAIIPPLALNGPVLSIRRFGVDPLTAADLVAHGSISDEILRFLSAAVKAKLNVLISGGTGTGKTTLLNVLSSYIPGSERVITIEDAAELQLQQRHVVRLETRPANVEGKGAVVQRDLVRNSLRMRPDRIIVGEVRGGEVLDMLQAMNTGHEGSMTTIHANSPRDALNRLMSMAALATANYSDLLLRQTVARTIELIIHINRYPDGRRRVVSVTEITGMEGDVISMQEIVAFEHQGVDADGHVLGVARFTGVRPRCLEKLARAGVHAGDGGMP
jgi:pilus assembly protein CpaF